MRLLAPSSKNIDARLFVTILGNPNHIMDNESIYKHIATRTSNNSIVHIQTYHVVLTKKGDSIFFTHLFSVQGLVLASSVSNFVETTDGLLSYY